jgi:hypothetical protein
MQLQARSNTHKVRKETDITYERTYVCTFPKSFDSNIHGTEHMYDVEELCYLATALVLHDVDHYACIVSAATVTITTQPQPISFGSVPQRAFCPNCHQEVTTVWMDSGHTKRAI